MQMQGFWKRTITPAGHISCSPSSNEEKKNGPSLAQAQIWHCHSVAVALGQSLPCSEPHTWQGSKPSREERAQKCAWTTPSTPQVTAGFQHLSCTQQAWCPGCQAVSPAESVGEEGNSAAGPLLDPPCPKSSPCVLSFRPLWCGNHHHVRGLVWGESDNTRKASNCASGDNQCS